MPLWQIALIGLVFAWCLQAVGTFVQMRQYRNLMGEVSSTWTDGFVGAGSFRSTFGAGIILLLVVGPDRVVRRLMVMKGRTVFARFNRVPDIEGQALDSLERQNLFKDKAHESALSIAIRQIEKAVARSASP